MTDKFSDVTAAAAINSIGVELLRKLSDPERNTLLSPYSIETASTMASAGADGKTREEMVRTLHLSPIEAEVHNAFSALQMRINRSIDQSIEISGNLKKWNCSSDPITLLIANRLFGQKDFEFRPPFLELLKATYNAPLEQLDFQRNPGGATKTINDWAEQHTQGRIRNLISGALHDSTRMVLVNAIYFKGPWSTPFAENATKPLLFHTGRGPAIAVPTMKSRVSLGYLKIDGLTVVSIPYGSGDFQFLIILPGDVKGLSKVETDLSAAQLAAWANLAKRDANLFLPKFKIESSSMTLTGALQELGMTSAFDKPPGSANFDRMAPRRMNDYLYISDVFHKAYLSVDENGAEAAAATAFAAAPAGVGIRPPEPIEVRVDRPFLFAIQHRASGACLFLGHVVDPR